ncbi:hypothetical protein CCICO_04900 [Corynebacterium ciconiae DSM 44920]|uniref:hypothetical protein n=1 Tax=Corynebacterium ciconiae TaxID=227319 RepID=UPI00036EAE0C|nr:hypothetical protein [Corynebacterium ciconiae]WKD61016.1 hypothetical protein CCICO_04900 [Corynebacterium ciconiae DSM 44920]
MSPVGGEELDPESLPKNKYGLPDFTGDDRTSTVVGIAVSVIFLAVIAAAIIL